MEDFQRYLDKASYNVDFLGDIFPRMKGMAVDAVKSVFHKIDPLKRMHTFEVC